MPNWTERLTEPFAQQIQKQRQAVEKVDSTLTLANKKTQKNWSALKPVVEKNVVAPLEKWSSELEKAWPQLPTHLNDLQNETRRVERFTAWGGEYRRGVNRVRFQIRMLRAHIEWLSIRQAVIKDVRQLWARLKSSDFLSILIILLVIISLIITLSLLIFWLTPR